MAQSRGHICHCLSRILSLRRHKLLTVSGDRRRTGGEFVNAVLGLADGLSELGLQTGDIVAIAAFNSDVYLEWILAVSFVGGILAPLNYRWSFEEVTWALELVRPTILVFDENCKAWALQLVTRKSIPSLRHFILINGTSSPPDYILSMDSIRKPSKGIGSQHVVWGPNDVALICFTSGTTGKPKGVAISHTSLIIQSLAKIAIVGYGEDDVYLHTAPLCHIGGLSSCMAMLMAGGCHVLIPKFDSELSFQAIEKYKITSLITVPAMMSDLIFYSRNAYTGKGRNSINKILNGGGSLSPELLDGAINIFPNAKIISAYGMTEACSSLTFMTLHDPALDKKARITNKKLPSHHQRATLVGKPAPHVELRIGADQSILTRGLHVMVGYWDQAKGVILDRDGHKWLDTGDIGWLDDNGDLWLVGRKKDRIKTGGENVYPEEVESVLLQHPGVSRVVVTGVPDIRLTEKVVACVAISEEWQWTEHSSSDNLDSKVLSGEILQNFCRSKSLTGFKIPKNFILWKKPFPLTSSGKLKREDVRKEAMSSNQLLSSNL